MSVHKLQIVEESGEVSLKLVCSAVPGATCRRRPTDDREEWSVDDPDLVLVDGDCWAVEWVSAVGWEDAVRMGDGTGVVVSVPVDVGYEEGVLLSVASADPELDGLELHTSERDGLDDCPACDASLASCSRSNVCCADCTHAANWPPLELHDATSGDADV